MKTRYTVALSMIAGVALGGAAIHGLHAQAKPPAYVITHTEIINQAAFNEFSSKVPATMQQFDEIELRRLFNWQLGSLCSIENTVAGGARASPASIRLDVGVLGHLSPHAELNLDESCQLLGRAGKSLKPHVLEARLNVRAIDDFA